MKTKIRFGMALDGARWTDRNAAIGEITCGPNGLMKFLETHLGLTGAETAAADRVSQYKAKIAAANCEWCRASFELDPWGTAKSLLALRDELVELGWNPEIGGSPRFEALGAIEKVDLPLGESVGDRMRSVQASVRTVSAEMVVVDDERNYPPVWKKVLDRYFPDRTRAESLQGNGAREGVETIVVTAPNEVMLAHDLVRYLAAKPEENASVAVVAGGDTTLLDGLLHRAGLPAIGGSSSSSAREAMQMLPLWIENMWAPFNPSKFIQLLGIAGSPVPGYVRRRLVNVLSNVPGIGSEEWNAAWDEISSEVEASGKSDASKKRISELRAFFESARYDPEGDGIPVGELLPRLDLLREVVAPRAAEHEEWHLVLGHIRKFRQLVQNDERVRRVDVSRILDSIYGVGIPREGSTREVSAYRVVDAPGQLLDDVDTVLWWGFNDQSGAGTYWSPSERTAMEAAGLSVDGDARLARELASWQNALWRAKKRLVCFAPETVGGAEAALHPFAVNLESAGPDAFHKVTDASLFDFETGVWTLADRSMQLVKRSVYRKEGESGAAALPKNEIRPKSLSATQLTTFISCPFRWIAEKYLGLRDAEVAQIAEGSRAIGLLAHKIVELLAGPGEEENRSSDKAGKRAGELFDSLLPERCAELLLPENADRRIRAREQLVSAVEVLFAAIEERHLEIKGTEAPLKAKFEGVPFEGAADMVLEDKEGRPVVFDFKWSRSKKYRESVKMGLSLQLAFYSWVLSPDEFNVASSYFLFPHREFIANIQDNKAAFNRVVDFYRHRLEDINAGRVDWGGPLFGTSETYPAFTEEENAQLEACKDDKARQKLEAELSATHLPFAYPAECEYCRCKGLCGMAKATKEEEEAE